MTSVLKAAIACFVLMGGLTLASAAAWHSRHRLAAVFKCG